MIYLKLFYEFSEYIHQQKGHINYTKDTFERVLISQSENGAVDPFTDAESQQLMNEIDNATLVSKYVIRTSEGEYPITCLSESCKYALCLLYYSRRGVHMEMKEYHKVWELLQNFPIDVYAFIVIPLMSEPSLDLLFLDKVVIENYKDEKGYICEKLLDGWSEIYGGLKHIQFDLKKDFENVVLGYARSEMEHTTIFEYPPLEFNSCMEFGKFLYQDSIYYEGIFFDEDEEFMNENEIMQQPPKRFSGIIIHNYLIEHFCPIQKYPQMILIERDEITKSYSVQWVMAVKNPTLGELIMTAGYLNQERDVLDDLGSWNKMVLAFDTPTPTMSGEWLKDLMMVQKLQDKTMSLYSGKRGWYELLKFIEGYQYVP